MHFTSSIEPRGNARLVGLDLLRLSAVLLVLGRHIPLPDDLEKIPFRGLFEPWQRGGWVGVDLFFVLSGFLVAGLLFAEYQARGSISPSRFYVRRGWKIYPAFYVMIGVTIFYALHLGLPTAPEHVVAEMLFLQSYLPCLWNHTWSLAVEEHFYFMLPLLLLALLRWNRSSATPLRPVLPLAAVVAVACLGLRIEYWEMDPVYQQTSLFPTHLRLDGLFFGTALSYLYHFHTARFVALAKPWRYALIGLGTALLTPAFAWPVATPAVFTVGLTAFYLGAGMLMIGVLMCQPPRQGFLAFVLRPVAALGSYSYSIYLWHTPFLTFGVPLVQLALGWPSTFAGAVVVYLVGSLAVGVVMSKLIEMPALRLRDRWFPSRSAGAI